MSLPTALPTKATPLNVPIKRRYSEVSDLTKEDDTTTVVQRPTTGIGSSTPQHGVLLARNNIEDDEVEPDDDNASMYEDYLDHFELEPWTELHKDSPYNVSSDKITSLKDHLRNIGPAEFLDDAINSKKMSIRHLGVVFGLDPHLVIGDDAYLQLLSRAIVRFFQKRSKLPQWNTIDDAAQLLQSSRNIMVITGAGISTSLGIPDFRSKGTGFYERIREMGYEEPEEVFDIHNFDENPGIFYSLAGDILPDRKRYTPTHAFIRLLQDKKRLQTNYTQNIDNLEEVAGIDKSRIIQCHGSFATATCRKCNYEVNGAEIFDDIRARRVPRCKKCIQDLQRARLAPPRPMKRSKSHSRHFSADSDEDDDIPEPGVMKPGITFFGQALPTTFFDRFTQTDAHQADLVIVIGTSLKVAPVSEMPNFLPQPVPHIYISREPIKHVEFDIQLLGNCDDVVYELSRRAGWELKHEMIPAGLQLEVSADPDAAHVSNIVRRKPMIADTDESDFDEDVRHQPSPSQTATNISAPSASTDAASEMKKDHSYFS